MKKLFYLVCSLLFFVGSISAADNLLADGGFEQSTAGGFFGSTWDEWVVNAVTAAETSDKLEGNQAMRFTEANMAGKVQQEVDLSTEVEGQAFQVTIHYKVLSATYDEPVSWACLWDGNNYEVQAHDEDKLNAVLPTGEGWQTATVETTKPKGATSLHVRISYKKKTLLLLDDWSLTRVTSSEPWLTITPETVAQVNANVGETKLAKEFTIRQGNLGGPVNLSLTGAGAAMFELNKTSVTAAEETVTVNFKPTKTGVFTAYLLLDATKNPEVNPSMIKLTGAASDPTQKPEITINPTTLPDFTCAVGEQVSKTVTVSAINCISNIEISFINGKKPETTERYGFSINNNLMPANIQNGQSVITFAPTAVGEYTATVWWQTEGGQAQRIDLKGIATPGGTITPDWQTAFDWSSPVPTDLLIERFDDAKHNETLLKTGWQNVVLNGKRPWWSFDKTNDSQQEEFYCAKATGYGSEAAEEKPWDMWLVTPPLKYSTAVNQVFTFRVRGDYLSDEMDTILSLYYIDATDPSDIWMQPIECGIPASADQSGEWVDIHVDLTGQEYIPDTFYMAFRYIGPNGVEGAVTYYIDDVTWGNPQLPVISADSVQITFQTTPGTPGGTEFTVTGKNLSEPIALKMEGPNPSSFYLANATTTSPGQSLTIAPAGDKVAIALKEDVEGVYEAYITLSSRGAATRYIPVACLVKSQTTGLEDQQADEKVATKVLRGSQILIRRGEAVYDLLGNSLR